MSNLYVISDIRAALVYAGCFPGGGKVYYFSFGPATTYEIEGAEVENLAAVTAFVFMDAGREFYRVRDAFNAGFHCESQGLSIPSVRKAVKNILLQETRSFRIRCHIRDHILCINLNFGCLVLPPDLVVGQFQEKRSLFH
ncbi:hypothetical protein [Desulfospira joergensenii]|uniref:hypothetical protein n=1 Tax=Desulfospira joergensenii TaxID=53329 RepID=UPI0003B720D6|nr:hypothetical protein [Desulfospira joergensenii]